MFPNLNAERARKGVTLEDLAKVLNIRTATMCEKLNGKYPITLDEAIKIKSYLEVDMPLDKLFEEVAE